MAEHSRRARGFTLVELLVVIGIIAVLISILLPSLGAAREQARTAKCLSNLKQIAMAAAAYTSANNGYIIPADVEGGVTDSFGRVWSDTWVTILVADKYLPYPRDVDPVVPPGIDNVFHCPSAILEQSQVTFGSGNVPATRKDAQGAMGYMHKSSKLEPGLHVYSWYGINATSNSNDKVWPCRRVTRSGNKVLGTVKSADIKKSSELAFLFDGLLGLNHMAVNANRLNARHGRQRITNIAFFDGHAESFETKSLPGGDGNANAQGGAAALYTLENLKKYTHPKWRLDQP